jgi:hypothetical protein
MTKDARSDGTRAEPAEDEEAGAPEPDERPSPRPGTRMLDLQPSSSDPMKQAAESLERFVGRHRGRILYALGLHVGGSVTLTVFDEDGAASAELSGPMVEQLIGQLRSRTR